MSLIDRRFKLASDAGDLGLRCTSQGLTLAGAPLLRVTVKGFAPRPVEALNALLRAAYGGEPDPFALTSGLAVVAKALNDGDLGRAMVAAVRLRLPELDATGAGRVASCEEVLSKAYNAQEPRDWHGRWTTGAAAAKPARLSLPRPRRAAQQHPALATKPPTAPSWQVVVQTAAAGVPPREDVWEAFKALHPNFQSQFDTLGPVEFARRVIEFADWIETQAHEDRPLDRAATKAEYYFLQNRLEFWLGSRSTSPTAHLNLISAASRLFSGATNARLVRPGDSDSFPKSLAATAGLAMTLDGSASGRGMPVRAVIPGTFQEVDARMPWLAERPSGVGGLVSNRDAGINWDGGIEGQGIPWEQYVASQLYSDYLYVPDSKGVDHFNPTTGDVINSKTLNTALPGYTFYPENIFNTLSKYITAFAKYVPGTKLRGWDVPPEKIQSRQIMLAVPEKTSPEQWAQIVRAQEFAERNGVKLNVTRIR